MNEPVLREGATPAVSPWRAALRVLSSPVETFRALGDRPPVLVPYLIHTLVGAVVLALTYASTMEVVDQNLAMVVSQPGMGAEEAAMAQQVAWWSAVVALVFQTVLSPWIAGFIVALVAMFFGQFQGGGVSLSAYMGMIGYARMPLAISWLLAGVFQAVTGQSLNLSAAAFLPEGSSAMLAAAMQMLNPLGLWYYALLAVGFAALFGREPRKGVALPIALLVAGTVIMVAMGGLSSALTFAQ